LDRGGGVRGDGEPGSVAVAETGRGVASSTTTAASEQAGLAHQADEVYTRYQDHRRDPFSRLAIPVLRTMPSSELLAAGVLEESALREVLAERARPHPDARARLMNVAVSYARDLLRDADHGRIRHPLAALYAYLVQHSEIEPRICARAGCQEPATKGGAYCRDACRQAAYRQRRNA
jgi:hypothetical protein